MRYYLHDKKADTAERVAWTATRNLGTDNPDLARRVMIATANRAEELKAAAGVKATGRKGTSGPVYAYSLAWHPDEAGKIDRAEMMRAAESSLIALGAEGHQAVIVAHQDEPQPHVHVIVNRVHPDTGRMLPTGNDHHHLSNWALAYREARKEQQKYCPQRAKNAAARELYPDQAQRVKFAQEREKAVKLARAFEAVTDPKKQTGSAIAARADAMKSRHARQWKELGSSYKAERENIWQSRTSFKAIAAQHRIETKPEWSAFGKQQARERREWQRAERSTAGLIKNALAAVASKKITGADKGYLRAVFWHCVSGNARHSAFAAQQAEAKATFAASMKERLDTKIAAAKIDTGERLKVARANYDRSKTALKDQQGGERAEIRAAWKTFFAFRDAAKPQPVPERAAGAQSVSELRAMYGDKARERNRDRDRSQSRRKERVRSRTRDRDNGPDSA